MRTLGIIAEYNPFHNGHLYHLNKSKQVTNSDAVVVIMSGSFTQAGNIAIYDKFQRAKSAIVSGADLVIELPVIFANSSAEYFAYGAVNILNSLNIINSLCFGSENESIEDLLDITDTIINNESKIWQDIKREMANGISFASARQLALSNYLNSYQLEAVSKSNNILGLEYLKSIKKLNNNIVPYSIKRLDNQYNDKNIDNLKEFISATSIRDTIEKNKDTLLLKGYVPTETFNIISNISPLFNDSLFNIVKYKILELGVDNIKNINEVVEGLEYKIIEAIGISKNYEEFINNIKSKRYQMSKIKRIIINILLNITKDDFEYLKTNDINYVHVLACSNNGKKLLSEISKKSNLELITNINEEKLSSLSPNTKKYLELDIFSTNIHSMLSNQSINKDYTNHL